MPGDGTYTYEYDGEGNRTKRTEIATGDYVEYTWDHRNRLVAVEFRTSADVLTKAVEFDYDVFDRLIAKRVDDDGNGVFDRAQKFVYDGLNAVLVYDDSGSFTNRMLYGSAVDQFFADEDALGEVLWGLTDHLGTVRDLVEYDSVTDTTSVVNHIEYDSFGNITAQTSASDQPLLAFTGRYLDPDTGHQWHNARWYDASTGLWLSPDPGGFTMGDANLYRYVENNPANWTDPSGMQSYLPGWNPYAPDQRPSRVMNDTARLGMRCINTIEFQDRLVDRYLERSGEPYRLTLQEMGDVAAGRLSIGGSRQFQRELREMEDQARRQGSAIQRPINVEGRARARRRGTLGTFTTRYRGSLTVRPDGSWSFDGEISYLDLWNFDARRAGERGWQAECQVRLFNALTFGEPFYVTSPWVRFQQSSDRWGYESGIPRPSAPVGPGNEYNDVSGDTW